MSRLHPHARSLIEAAKRHETPLSNETRAKVRRSVLRRAAAFGPAMTAAGSAAAKTGLFAVVVAHPALSTGVVAAALAVAFVGGRAATAPSGPATASAPGASGQEVRLVPPHGGQGPVVARATPAEPIDSIGAIAPTVPVVGAEGPGRVAPTGHLAPIGHLAPTGSADCGRPSAPPASPQTRGAPSAAATAPSTAGVTIRAPMTPGVSSERVPVSHTGADLGAAITLPQPRPASDVLAGHVELLREVHDALLSHRADRALAILDGHAASLRAGPLGEQAQAARVAALCQMGRDEQARAALRDLSAAWPASPAALTLVAACPALGDRGASDD